MASKMLSSGLLSWLQMLVMRRTRQCHGSRGNLDLANFQCAITCSHTTIFSSFKFAEYRRGHVIKTVGLLHNGSFTYTSSPTLKKSNLLLLPIYNITVWEIGFH